MKKYFLAVALLFSAIIGSAQNTAGGGSHFSAYQQYVNQHQIPQAVDEGVKASAQLTQAGKWKEAFATCRDLDALVRANGNVPALNFKVTKERLRMYTHMRKSEQCKGYINQLYAYTQQDPSLTEDFLLTSADFYKTFGMTDKSLECYKKLFYHRSAGKDLDGIEKCYTDMIALGKSSKNSLLSSTMRRMYASWQDSIKMIKAAYDYKKLTGKYNTTQTTLKERESTITAQKVSIVFLCILAVALAGGLLFILMLLFRYIRKVKKLKNSLDIANENNEQKSHFINNISSQISPTLDVIVNAASAEQQRANVEGLKNLIADIQAYAALEEEREERYELEEINAAQFAEDTMKKAGTNFAGQLPTQVNAPRMDFKTNPEVLEHILSYVLTTAAHLPGTEKLALDFKKRSAHSVQFIITAHGAEMAEDERADLFKPFARLHDLTQETGLGLPMCSLMAYKLNGALHLDEEYTHGLRFVVDLRDK